MEPALILAAEYLHTAERELADLLPSPKKVLIRCSHALHHAMKKLGVEPSATAQEGIYDGVYDRGSVAVKELEESCARAKEGVRGVSKGWGTGGALEQLCGWLSARGERWEGSRGGVYESASDVLRRMSSGTVNGSLFRSSSGSAATATSSSTCSGKSVS